MRHPDPESEIWKEFTEIRRLLGDLKIGILELNISVKNIQLSQAETQNVLQTLLTDDDDEPVNDPLQTL